MSDALDKIQERLKSIEEKFGDGTPRKKEDKWELSTFEYYPDYIRLIIARTFEPGATLSLMDGDIITALRGDFIVKHKSNGKSARVLMGKSYVVPPGKNVALVSEGNYGMAVIVRVVKAN